MILAVISPIGAQQVQRLSTRCKVMSRPAIMSFPCGKSDNIVPFPPRRDPVSSHLNNSMLGLLHQPDFPISFNLVCVVENENMYLKRNVSMA